MGGRKGRYMTDLQKKLQTKIDHLNCQEHDEYCSREYNGNTRDYRVTTHDGACYFYISDWYRIGMQSWPVAALSDAQCSELLAGHNAYYR